MKQSSQIHLLKEAVSKILLPGDFHDELAPAIRSYSELLFKLGDINVQREVDRANIETNFGKAIGPVWAAFCVKEVFRTQRFCRGLFKAIKDRIDQGKEQVRVLYAGTGPLATLALPSMLMFGPEQLQFTLVEINEESVRRLRKVLDELGLNEYVSAIEIGDATIIQLKEKNFDIIISETMNRALSKEPQIAIMVNLVSQVNEDVVIIPEEITVCLSEINKNKQPVHLKELIRFNKDFISKIPDISVTSKWQFEEHLVELSGGEVSALMLTTDIVVYKDERLSYLESSLNLPQKLKFPRQQDIRRFSLQYRHQEKPGFQLLLLKEDCLV